MTRVARWRSADGNSLLGSRIGCAGFHPWVRGEGGEAVTSSFGRAVPQAWRPISLASPARIQSQWRLGWNLTGSPTEETAAVRLFRSRTMRKHHLFEEPDACQGSSATLGMEMAMFRGESVTHTFPHSPGHICRFARSSCRECAVECCATCARKRTGTGSGWFNSHTHRHNTDTSAHDA